MIHPFTSIDPCQPGRCARFSRPSFSGLLVAGLLGLSALAATAQITNTFTDGEGSTTSDQYPGTAENGWVEGWNFQFGVNSGAAGFFGTDPIVTNTNPLFASGNYFNWGMANSESSMRRKFVSTGDLNSGLAHIVEFDLRMDSFLGTFTSASDGVSICTRRTLGTDVGGNATFWIRAQAANDGSAPLAKAGSWNFYDGGALSSSDASGNFTNSAGVVPFAIGRAYRFKVQLNPVTKTYVGSVTDGTNTFTTAQLRYKSFSDNNVANISNSTIFQVVSRTSSRVVQPATTETNIISLDNVKIYADVNAIAPLITQVTPAAGHIFYPATSNLVFSATTIGPANTLPASGTTLTLNGVNVSGGLTFSGSDSDTNRTITYAGLVDNTIYTGSIVVKDQANRSTTNSFFFDTFVETNVTVIEAENYNFEQDTNSCPNVIRTNFNPAGYLQNPLPSGLDVVNGVYINEVDGYVDRAGVAGVDYFDASANVLQSEFRLCDTFDTRKKSGAEFLRPAYITHVVDDYILEHVDAGDWANYTHTYPGSNYYVYLRVGARNREVHYSLSRVTSSRTQPNQTTVPLGTFTAPRLAARETLMYRPLADAFGNPVLMNFNGEQTLRLTALDASNNDDTYVNFMLLNPQAGTVAPPFVFQYYPKAGESNIPPQTAITLTLANGSAPISTGTIVLNVDGTNVTSSAVIAANAGGATVNYLPPTLFPRFSIHSVQVIYGDGSSLQTNAWTFHVGGYLPGTLIKVNFQQPTSTNFPGYVPDTSLSFGTRTNATGAPAGLSYGWDRDFPEDTRQSFPTTDNGSNSVPVPDQRYATFTHLNKASPPRIFELTLPNGNYGVFAVSGDPTAIDSVYKIAVEGVLIVDGTPSHPDQWVSGSNVVTVADGRLTLTTPAPSGTLEGGQNNKINFIDIYPLDYPVPDFTLRNPAVNGSTFSFSLSTISRAQHVIEYKTQLTDPTWTVLTNIVGTGSSVTVTDPVSGQRLYRMRIP